MSLNQAVMEIVLYRVRRDRESVYKNFYPEIILLIGLHISHLKQLFK